MAFRDFIDLGGTTAALLAGLVVGIVADPLRQWLLRARLLAEFQDDDECVRDTPATFNTQMGQQQGRGTYTRVRVKNAARFTARTCRPYLAKIEAQDEQGRFSTLFSDTLPLTWAYLNFQPVDIPRGVWFFYDIFYTFPGTRYVIPETEPKPQIFAELLSRHRRYRFTTIVAGENVPPITTVLEVHWKGDGSSKPNVRKP
jgi:hypothetical protein